MRQVAALVVALTVAVALTADAQQTAPAAKSKGDEPWLKFTITTQEQAVLKQHYASEHPAKQKELPPGLQKKVARGGTLPPGWQKKVARGEVMSDDVYRHSTPLPKEVLIKLPPPPRGTILVKVEGKVVRLLEATKTIIDVLDL